MSDYYNIPEEILIEILLKLPSKLLIRHSSVCKAWKSLIRSPLFVSLHLANAEKQLLTGAYNFPDLRYDYYSLIAKTEHLSIKSIDSPNFNCPIGTDYRVIGSCNGLLCLSIQSSVCYNRPPLYVNVIIWNPCTRNHVILPQFLENPKEVNQVLLGFGVASNVYKVVRLVYLIDGTRAEIFTLGTMTWRKLSFAGRVRCNHEYCWFFKGFVHWIVSESKDPFVHCNSILTFDVGDEVFGEIKLPEEVNFHKVETLAIIGESFGLVDFKWGEGRLKLDVWIMKDYGVRESWTKLYMIDGFNGKIDDTGMMSIVGFLKGTELLVHRYDFGFVIYNAKTKESKPVKHVGDFGENLCSWYVDEFKESLVLPEGSIVFSS